MQTGDYVFFTAKFACVINQKMQLYLGVCLKADLQDDVQVKKLSFHEVQDKIVEGSFESKLLPAIIQWQLQSGDASRNNTNYDDGADQWSPCEETGPGWKTPNCPLNPRWTVSKDDHSRIGFFVTSFSCSLLRWGQKKICFKYHCVGECNSKCPFCHSHEPMCKPLSAEFDMWFINTLAQWNWNVVGPVGKPNAKWMH